jgi:hypothetical protein
MFCKDVIHDLPHPLEALRGIHKALTPGGKFSIVDMFVSSFVKNNVGDMMASALYAQSTFMCIPESYQEEDSEALGACWGREKASQLCTQAGFKVVGISMIHKDGDATGLCMCDKL